MTAIASPSSDAGLGSIDEAVQPEWLSSEVLNSDREAYSAEIALLVWDGFCRVSAAILLVASVPIITPVAVLVMMTSPGAVFYRQTRVGYRGQPFTMWKLRTMVEGAHHMVDDMRHLNDHDGILFKITRDPRVTRIGRWLRRLSLDELPQLWNVVKGEMALVGPRPALPTEVARYEPHILRRLDVKPGLTGLWQVSGRSDLSWEESARLDLEYVARRRPSVDMRIIARTPGVVLRGSGAR